MQTYDPVTSALTGALPILLLAAAALTWPVAVVLLRLYQRAVRRSMRRRAGEPGTAPPAADVRLPPEGGEPPDVLRPLHTAAAEAEHARRAGARFHALLNARWRAAGVYALGGVAYALVMAVAVLRADGTPITPLRLLFTAWLYLWPVVPAVGIVAAAVRAEKAAVTAAYFAGLGIIGAAGIALSPELTWLQVLTAWAVFNLPTTILLLAFLARRVRAVGPLVFVFMLLSLLGSQMVLAVAGSSDAFLLALVEGAIAAGVGAMDALLVTLVAAFLTFAVAGWIALAWIRRRYEAKRISDESLTLDALWLLFTAAHGIGLAFAHPLWMLASLAAFGAFKAVTALGFRVVVRPPPSAGPRLLLLRSFAIGADSERLFDALEKGWRRAGSIQLIAGLDLARRTVEPHEFLEFVSGKLSRRFIDGQATLERRIRESDPAPDRDGRFRVNDFFCYDDTWRAVFMRLAAATDAVLMDLRGFSPENRGCVFEIRELVNAVPLERIVFVVDRRTREPFLRSVLAGAFADMSPTSPNASGVPPKAGAFHLDSLTRPRFRRMLAALASAAAARPTGARA